MLDHHYSNQDGEIQQSLALEKGREKRSTKGERWLQEALMESGPKSKKSERCVCALGLVVPPRGAFLSLGGVCQARD